MKLNTKAFRYLSAEDWRVLVGVELGSKNHEVVPTPLIIQLSGLRAGSSGANRSIATLAKENLIAKVKNMTYDGYRLTYGGLDYLALHGHTKSDAVVHIGSQMGVGKESDIYLVLTPASPTGSSLQSSSTLSLVSQATSSNHTPPVQAILKLHRLGRISFRNVRNKRSYLGNRANASWHYLSRLSAHKEFLCMRALYDAGFPVPTPIAWNRHTIVMSLVPGIPLRQVPLSAFELAAGGRRAGTDARDAEIAKLYGQCMEMVLRLAEVGVIHGDFNEFNLLIENVPDPEKYEEDSDDEEPANASNLETNTSAQPQPPPPSKPLQIPPPMSLHLIDFPQITSLSHPQASFFFARDVACIKRFFHKRYHFESSGADPTFADAEERLQKSKKGRIDVEIEAAGFSRKMARELNVYFEETATVGEDGEGEGGEDEEDEEDELFDEEESVVDESVATGDSTTQNTTVDDLHPQAHPLLDRSAEEDRNSLNATLEQQDDMLEIIKKPAYSASVAASDTAALSDRLDSMSVFSTRERPHTRAKAKAGWSI